MRVLRGAPTDDELAALIAVLAAAAGTVRRTSCRAVPRRSRRPRRRGPGRPPRAARAAAGRPPLTRSGRSRPRSRAGRSAVRRPG
ncbi:MULTISPECIES: acyl-CoA carboxylase epsilon subunit [unclassified Pseudonocardia]|uniref:acyl-CoA carboxylase epsilon subunit n=1 Tax=unclassified Pseudonocardia TaxID=2619320 RepID=UPI002100994D|nr:MULTISPECIES: acyl-CoA carboxylase epsilon subunit [unclassified Pseudonocardia]